MSLIDNSKKEENDITLSSSLNSDINKNEILQTNDVDMESSLDYNREEETKLKPNTENSKNKNNKTKKYLLYGNHIDNLKPKYLGKTRAFCYINNYPLFTIGPDCK